MWPKLRIWPHLLKKSLMENFIFRAVTPSNRYSIINRSPKFVSFITETLQFFWTLLILLIFVNLWGWVQVKQRQRNSDSFLSHWNKLTQLGKKKIILSGTALLKSFKIFFGKTFINGCAQSMLQIIGRKLKFPLALWIRNFLELQRIGFASVS